MPVYVLSWVKVQDREALGRYASQVGPVLARHGGRFLFAGGGSESLEGDWNPEAMAIIEFPTREDALRWHDSDEYAPLIELRRAAGETAVVITPETDD